MTASAPSRWTRRLFALCLRAWPSQARARDGAPLLRALLDDLEARPGRLSRAFTVATECASLVATGVRMRAGGVLGAAEALLAGLPSDARIALRSLRRAPVFAITVSSTLAVGMAANATVLGLVDRVLLADPPFRDPDALVFVWNTLGASAGRFRVAAPDAARLEADAPALSELAFLGAPRDGGLARAGGDAVEHVRVSTVSPDLLRILGREPLLGASFGSDPGSGGALLSNALWTRSFGADRDAVGSTILLDGTATAVLGILPPDLRVEMPPDVGMGGDVDVWVPLPAPLAAFERGDGRSIDQDSDNSGAVLARLADGASLAQARKQAERVWAALREEVPEYDRAELGVVVRPVHADATAHLEGLLTALLLGAGGLLVVTCLNVSTLSLGRAQRRVHEVATRRALGAGGLRVARGAALESLLLVGIGTGGALLLASALGGVLDAVLPAGLAASGAGADGGALLGTALVAVVVLAAFNVGPALTLSGSAWRGGERSGADRRSVALRGWLVGAQVALSLVLATAAGLLGREAWDLGATDVGFDPAGAATFSVSVRDPARYAGPAARAELVREITAAVSEIPGVTAVGTTAHLPLSGVRWTQPYAAPGGSPLDAPLGRADFVSVTSGYFGALGIPVLDGRVFTPREDVREEARIVVVDARLAAAVAPDGRAVGRRLSFPLDGAVVEAEIVGVVGSVRAQGLRDGGREALYVPYRQEASREVAFVVRTERDPTALAGAIRTAVATVDTGLPLYGLRRMDGYVADLVAPTALAVRLVGAFALLVLLCVAIGLSGLVALEVSRRARDIGIRIAIGAPPATVVRSVVRRTLRLAVAGGIAGIAGVGLSWPVVSAAAPGRTLADPWVWGVVLATVATVVAVASWVPARRAARTDPRVALSAR